LNVQSRVCALYSIVTISVFILGIWSWQCCIPLFVLNI